MQIDLSQISESRKQEIKTSLEEFNCECNERSLTWVINRLAQSRETSVQAACQQYAQAFGNQSPNGAQGHYQAPQQRSQQGAQIGNNAITQALDKMARDAAPALADYLGVRMLQATMEQFAQGVFGSHTQDLIESIHSSTAAAANQTLFGAIEEEKNFLLPPSEEEDTTQRSLMPSQEDSTSHDELNGSASSPSAASTSTDKVTIYPEVEEPLPAEIETVGTKAPQQPESHQEEVSETPQTKSKSSRTKTREPKTQKALEKVA